MATFHTPWRGGGKRGKENRIICTREGKFCGWSCCLKGPRLSKDAQIVKILNSLYEVVACSRCGTRIRFGDSECPHCGIDVDDVLRQWAARLLDKLDA